MGRRAFRVEDDDGPRRQPLLGLGEHLGGVGAAAVHRQLPDLAQEQPDALHLEHRRLDHELRIAAAGVDEQAVGRPVGVGEMIRREDHAAVGRHVLKALPPVPDQHAQQGNESDDRA